MVFTLFLNVLGGLFAAFARQSLFYLLGNEGREWGAILDELANEGGADVRCAFACHEEERFDAAEVAVGEGHAKFKLKVRKGPQASHDDIGLDLFGVIDDEGGKGDDLALWVLSCESLEHRHSFLYGEEEAFPFDGIHGDTYVELVAYLACALDDVEMAKRGGIKRPWH